MLSKLSVKKPMTIFVAVVLVIVLGIVSFMRMTPDLLPNMDFPYIVIVTTYPGQTPETVETTVSKPLEQASSIIDGVKQVTSTSSENYSLVMIEFEDGTDMNTATVDVRGSLDSISEKWPDGVGAPNMIKANPNMMPVAMAAVNYKDKDISDLSDYVSNDLMSKLQGIDGVASVSTKGLITEKENIVVSQDKITALNNKISDALDSQFAKAEDKLSDAKKQIKDNITKAESGSQKISSSISDINKQQDALAKQLSSAQAKAQGGYTKILEAKMQLLDQKAALTTTKQTLETSYQALFSIQSQLGNLTAQKTELTNLQNLLDKLSVQYQDTLSKLNSVDTESAEYQQLQNIISSIKTQLEPYGIKITDMNTALSNTKASLTSVNNSINLVSKTLTSLKTSPEKLDSFVKSLAQKITQINGGITQIDSVIKGLDSKTVTVSDALAELSKQQSSATYKMGTAFSTLTSKQSELSSAVTQLKSAEKELDSKIDEVSKQKETAKTKADVSNTITLDSVSGILTAQNFSMPAGYVSDDKNTKFMVRVGDKVDTEEDLKALPLFDTGVDGIGVITLEDVADIFMVNNSDKTYTKLNGNDGVVLSFSKQSDAATSTVCDNINAEFNELNKNDKNLNFTMLYSQGDYIGLVVNNVLQNLLLGALFAIIILFLFLRDIKPTFIVACSIPISVIFAIVLMYFSGVTLNMISLSGLAIGVGMLVDNSVVVIENIYRLRSLGYSAVQAALNGARQVAGAIAASTLTTICVFFPIVFVEGITRQIFSDMALTIAYSLLASLIVALTLVPAMGQRMLVKVKTVNHKRFDSAMNYYEKSLRFVLRHKIVTIIVVIAILIGSTVGAISRGFSFMPSMSSTDIGATIQLDRNTSFEDTVKTAEKVNEVLKKHKEFETVGIMTGSTMSLMGMSGSDSSSDAGMITAYAVLKDDYTKQSENISKKIKEELSFVNGDVSLSGSSASSMTSVLGDSGVTIKLFCDDLKTLQNTAKDLADKLKTVKGVDTVDDGVGATSSELDISVNKENAVKKNLTVAQIYQQIASAVSNEKTSTTLTNANGDDMDVVVVKDEKKEVSPDNIKNIDLSYTDKQGNTKTVKLKSVADINYGSTMNSISREDQKRYISVTGTLKDGYTTTEVSNSAKEVINDYKLPNGCSIEYGGADKTTMDSVYQLIQMLALGLVLIYLIMAAQFQSLKSPFIIMFTIPLAFTGGFLALLITGFDVSVVSLIGFVMLCGIIVNNGIVLVDYINKLRLKGTNRVDALVEAGKTRMRPILITALTTVLGLSVMALGIGTGMEMMQPVAIVCIGGLLYATFMTLYIIPLIYDVFNKKELRKVEDKDLEEISE